MKKDKNHSVRYRTGNGISSIEKTATNGLIDTYTITFTNGNTTTFTVTNGADGVDGQDGVGVKSAALDENGNLIITLTNNTVFNLGANLGKDGANGKDGAVGKDGKDGINGKDGATPFIGENGNWWIGETDTGVRATPVDVSEITLDDEGNLIYTLSDGTTKNAGSVANNAAIQAMAGVNEVSITQEDISTVKTLATVATILSSIS